MLTYKNYEELTFSILASPDPILSMLDTELEYLTEAPGLWQKIRHVMKKVRGDERLAEIHPSRFDSILKTVEVFYNSKWDRDENIPSELFNLDHFFFCTNSEYQSRKNKIIVDLGTDFTVQVMEGLYSFKLSKEEYNFFKSCFYGRIPARDYGEELDNGTSGTLDKIFNRPKNLRPELREYYFTNIKAMIMDYLSNKKVSQIDFNLAFDERMKAENEPRSIARPNSGIRLNRDKQGAKTDLLRILDALYDLRFFNDDEGQLPTKEFVMKAFGEFLGDDFSAYANILSQSYNNTSETANMSIFEQLDAKIRPKCQKKT